MRPRTRLIAALSLDARHRVGVVSSHVPVQRDGRCDQPWRRRRRCDSVIEARRRATARCVPSGSATRNAPRRTSADSACSSRPAPGASGFHSPPTCGRSVVDPAFGDARRCDSGTHVMGHLAARVRADIGRRGGSASRALCARPGRATTRTSAHRAPSRGKSETPGSGVVSAAATRRRGGRDSDVGQRR